MFRLDLSPELESLKIGDRILEVNGSAVRDKSLEEVTAAFGYTLNQQKNFLLQSQLCVLTLIRCPFQPRVTAVARKRPRPFCQKCSWQVTPKHAYTFDPTKSQWADYTAVQA